MNGIASRGQLRASFLRWAIVTVPFTVLLGLFSASLAPSGSGNSWYVTLAKPALNPPDWVFPVVWTALYVLMGLALAMIVNARGARGRGKALALFAAQLVANLAWSPVFFGLHQLWGAFAILIAMLVLAIATTFAFARIRRGAAWLMLPYLVWICFAGALNFSIARMNPDASALVRDGSTTQIAL